MKARQPLTPARALDRAEELCSRAEHCSGEIRRKLHDWGVGGADSAAIIESLVKRRFIDDARFARIFTREKVEYAGWGRRKIAAALAAKSVPRDAVAEAFEAIDEEVYRQRLADAVARKARSMDDADTYEGRTRIFRHAVSRGYEPALVIEAIKAL